MDLALLDEVEQIDLAEEYVEGDAGRKRSPRCSGATGFHGADGLDFGHGQPQSWGTRSGPSCCGAEVGGWLVVAQSREVLDQIVQLLAQLREASGRLCFVVKTQDAAAGE